MILTTQWPDLTCVNCGKKYAFSVPMFATDEEMLIAYHYCRECRNIIQPERSKRKDLNDEDAVL